MTTVWMRPSGKPPGITRIDKVRGADQWMVRMQAAPQKPIISEFINRQMMIAILFLTPSLAISRNPASNLRPLGFGGQVAGAG
ncbi:MAG: hypothetical protein H6869_10125 [Rhodospirillales bacterium]|nr:hypothetical protein [Rhodospirillales bacterium]